MIGDFCACECQIIKVTPNNRSLLSKTLPKLTLTGSHLLMNHIHYKWTCLICTAMYHWCWYHSVSQCNAKSEMPFHGMWKQQKCLDLKPPWFFPCYKSPCAKPWRHDGDVKPAAHLAIFITCTGDFCRLIFLTPVESDYTFGKFSHNSRFLPHHIRSVRSLAIDVHSLDGVASRRTLYDFRRGEKKTTVRRKLPRALQAQLRTHSLNFMF